MLNDQHHGLSAFLPGKESLVHKKQKGDWAPKLVLTVWRIKASLAPAENPIIISRLSGS